MHFLFISNITKGALKKRISQAKSSGTLLAWFRFVSRSPRQQYRSDVVKVFIKPVGRHLRVTTSSVNGWPFIETLIERYHWKAASVRYDPQNVVEIIVWFGGIKPRVLRTLREDRWTWFTDGPALPFEDLSLYKARRVKDRLSAETIERYLNSMGYTERLKKIELSGTTNRFSRFFNG